jgi:hypothetical protein
MMMEKRYPRSLKTWSRTMSGMERNMGSTVTALQPSLRSVGVAGLDLELVEGFSDAKSSGAGMLNPELLPFEI